MPTPALALKLKKYRRRFGVLSPRVEVRRYLPRPVLVVMTVLFGILMLGLGWGAASYWGGFVGGEVGLRELFQQQREELLLLRSVAGAGQNAVSIERATHQQLLLRIGLLEAENAALKEDMRIFERLIPRVSEGASVRIDNFRVVNVQGGHFRYRLLVVFQPDKQQAEFRGRLQLVVNYTASGVVERLVLPGGRDASGNFQFEVRNFIRREGGFELPPSAILQSVEARLLQGDTIKSSQFAQL